ncbi:hypothetical protein DPEC_G00172160 [Dallia pectoralis]|uniref:Uncharacterized protein n=1 Tax=Dallia pectoralis TaxID=75939 RepID=A0ACC2GDD6_DALPE|nr:hypothetical protein DPEC_G00172160 [Dallia pectoralis]
MLIRSLKMAVMFGLHLRVSWIMCLLIGGITGFPSPTGVYNYISQTAPQATSSSTSTSLVTGSKIPGEVNVDIASGLVTGPNNPSIKPAIQPQQNSSRSTSFNSPQLLNSSHVPTIKATSNPTLANVMRGSQEAVTGQSGPAPVTGQSGPAPVTGQSGPAPVTGQSGPAPVTGQSGPAPVTGQSGPAPVTGQSGPAPVTGQSGPAPVTGQSGPAPVTGQSGPAPVTGQSGPAPVTGQSRQ